MTYPFEPDSLVVPLVFLAVILSISAMRSGRPGSIILAKWALWICVSLGVATTIQALGLSARPLWVTALFCFLLWTLLETLYNWVAIDALSRSGIALFPPYKVNENGSEWPADPAFIALRETLRREQFHFVAAAIRPFGDSEQIRCPVYESGDGFHRMQIYFIPSQSGDLQCFLSLATQIEGGFRIVTDNVFLPFGGFYPENVFVERRPMTRSPGKLIARHLKRLARMEAVPVKWSVDPVTDMNEQQKQLEELNVALGFFVEPAEREELGNISREGRYRLWLEIWMLNYLGKPLSY
ncbi:MAG TPA: hypothetical protein PKI32_02360 [Opitutales bacterium]|nr:hypothetical protein [Opitutales bacterium]